MKFIKELLPGAHLVELKRFQDDRGSFVKTYSRQLFEASGVAFDLREEFYSFSRKNVVRGMHFQVPPHDHDKLIFCAAGAVLDVLVDLRSGANQGRISSIVLRGDEPAVLLIPKGVAHGFKSLSDESLMVYKTSTEYSPEHDKGIRWDSIGFNWDVLEPVISARDASHPSLADFANPF